MLVRDKRSSIGKYFIFLLLVSLLKLSVDASVIPLDVNNIDSVLAKNEIVFVNFYADWCRFSQHLKPIFEETSRNFENLPGRITFASVDSDRNSDIASKYHVSKYPTLKLFRNGELVKKEYRGQRSVVALSEYIQKQAESTVDTVESAEEFKLKMADANRIFLGYFTAKNNEAFKVFERVASTLRDECKFLAGVGDWISSVSPAKNMNAIFFRDAQSGEDNFQYTGPVENYDYLKRWLSEKCVPLVREITFENAEELTEEGLPFLILFRNAGDTASEKLFTDVVFNELSDQKSALNCLMAEGKRFAHPLHHLGKTERDLPVIAIDSFRHMYLFPNFADIREKGKLRQFVLDLHTGKLHREFHHGPDPKVKKVAAGDGTQPPQSAFNKLKPSEDRYSLLNKEEL